MRRWRLIGRVVVYGGIAVAIATGVPPSTQRGTHVWREAIPSDSVPTSTTEAELQGSRTPRSRDPGAFTQRALAMATVGTADRQCLVVGDANGARSGDLIGAPFQLYTDFWRRGGVPKLNFASGHRPPIGEPIQLIVKASRLDAPATSYVYVGPMRTYRWSALAMAKLMKIQWWTAARVHPPAEGRWLLVASLGTDWGCFVLDLPPITYP